jgi:hypothetical protein
MAKTPIESDGLLDRGSVTPMKSVIVGTQTTLQPTVLAQYGTSTGTFKFSGFGAGGVLVMQVAPRYRIEIIDCWAKGNATPAGNETVTIQKVPAVGLPLAIAGPTTMAFAGTLLETVRYTLGEPTAVLANFTVDPALGEFIRVTGAVTGGATVTILFNLV